MNPPTPALVAQRAVERLPRPVLLVFCAAYLLPGLFGRDPWRNADLTAFGYMLGMAEGRMSWWAPSLGQLPAETALLPHWIGALAIQWSSPWLDPALAARLPFGAMLAVTLALIWYATYHLAKTDAAQPVPFAFGGEAEPVAYARALADGALLATVASLGLLQMGHETTPELLQLMLMALLMWSLAAAPADRPSSKIAALLCLPALALSGAPSVAMALGCLAMPLSQRSQHPGVRSLWKWLLAGLLVAAALASFTGAWQWRISLRGAAEHWLGFARQVLWFTWPVLPLSLWTLWRWRGHWAQRHLAIPLVTIGVACASSIMMAGSDRALLLAMPGMAILAAFALPTLKRSAGAAMDWFSVFFFSLAALAIWVTYLSMQIGVPAQPTRNILRLAPGFEPRYSAVALGFALVATAAWVALVRWRTSRHRHPLWKSLVLPASGVALSWLLTMTLLLPVLDYARSTRALVAQIKRSVPPGSCLSAPGLPRAHVAGLEVFGSFKVDAREQPGTSDTGCTYRLSLSRKAGQAPDSGWEVLARLRRPADRNEYFTLSRRIKAAEPAQN
ncbi:hypothetical protein [Ideonella sp.]|uniref:hypothetical protein n=1 Tax=Ideonella sp. TaxID=1929293 RepID=UPI003BB6BE7F